MSQSFSAASAEVAVFQPRPLVENQGPGVCPYAPELAAEIMLEGMSESITIRHAEPSDFAAFHKIFTHPGVIRGTVQLPYPSLESWRKKLESPPPDFYSLVACVDGEVVGHLGLSANSRPRRRHVGSLGMAVRDDWQGQGVGSALLTAALELADGWLKLTRLELTVYTDNLPAIKLYEKFGFVREGTHKQYAFRDGALVDAYAMARLRD